MANLVRRNIKPALDKAGLSWRGWHAFRRGLATNLYSLGVSSKIIQAILRHSDIGTTLAYYVQVPPEESRAALAQMESLFLESQNETRIMTAREYEEEFGDGHNEPG